ncbi:hypothetical protein JTE90_028294, partial [Oedothorax gibbosus]
MKSLLVASLGVGLVNGYNATTYIYVRARNSSLIGFSNTDPNLDHHDIHGSAPLYLLDLYNSLEDPSKIEDLKPVHRFPICVMEKDRRFWFDVSEVPLEEDMVSAEYEYSGTSQKESQIGEENTFSVCIQLTKTMMLQ